MSGRTEPRAWSCQRSSKRRRPSSQWTTRTQQRPVERSGLPHRSVRDALRLATRLLRLIPGAGDAASRRNAADRSVRRKAKPGSGSVTPAHCQVLTQRCATLAAHARTRETLHRARRVGCANGVGSELAVTTALRAYRGARARLRRDVALRSPITADADEPGHCPIIGPGPPPHPMAARGRAFRSADRFRASDRLAGRRRRAAGATESSPARRSRLNRLLLLAGAWSRHA